MDHRAAHINSFAFRSFRDMADGDYIAARAAYRSQLVAQFLWLSQQALEKYFKCILLLNRIPATKLGHDLTKALDLAELKLPFSLLLCAQTRAFINHVNTYGQSRYLENSFYVQYSELVRLDRAVWDLRRYCAVLDYEVKLPGGKVIRALDVELQRIQHSEVGPTKPFRIFGGFLESVIEKKDHAARSMLIWNNLYFGKRPRRSVTMSTYSSATNSPLFLHPQIVDDLVPLIHISKELKASCYKQIGDARNAKTKSAASTSIRGK